MSLAAPTKVPMVWGVVCQHEVVIAPGKDGTDSNLWPHLHFGLICYSHMAPVNDRPSWMDYSSYGGRGWSEGLSAHRSAWDPGGVARFGWIHHGPNQSFIPLAWNLYGQNGAISQDWYPWLVLQIMQDN